MTTGPISARRARFPDDYGARGGDQDAPLPWGFVEERLRAALNYWVGTVAPGGRPHVRPIDGVWVDGALCFGGSDRTRWVRNLRANPAISVNLASETEAIILEGTGQWASASHPLAEASARASMEKYPQYFKDGTPAELQPFWYLRPAVVYAWTLEGFPNRATKWTFE